MDIPEVRRRVRAAIEQARRDAAARRTRSDEATRAYDEFLTARAIPALNTLAGALVAEGRRFKISTPAGAVRLSSDSAADDYVELTLDDTEDPPVVLCRTNFGRGRRATTTERPLPRAVADLTDEDVVDFVLAELTPFLAR